MDYLNYLFPTETFGVIIIAVQAALFLIWFVYVVKMAIRLNRIKRQIKRCDDVSALAGEIDVSSISNEATAQTQLEDFCRAHSVPPASPVFSHLKTLFLAGFNRSTLDIQALNKSTSASIASSGQWLRSVLSLFIVLGLLGTLFGLATSLSKLSIVGKDTLPNNVLSDKYQLMLENLSGAFTPSMVGVFLTILGVAIFAILQQYSLNVCLLLEKVTLSNWVIHLFPTTTQQLFKQLEQSERQIKENFDAAQKVAEFATGIQEDAGGLKKDISDARLKFKELQTASENLVEFSHSFSKSVHNFPEFQSELRSLNKQMLQDSELLQVTIGNSIQSMNQGIVEALQTIDSKLSEFLIPMQTNFNESLNENKTFLENNREFLTTVRTHFVEQNTLFKEQATEQRGTLNALLQSLKIYEDTYLLTRQSIDETLLKTLTAVEEANLKLGDQNEALIRGVAETIGTPLREELAVRLGEIAPELGKVSTTLSQTAVPLDLAAARMSVITEKFDENTINMVSELKREFELQNRQNFQYLEVFQAVNSNIASLNENLNTLGRQFNNFTAKNEKVFERPSYVNPGPAKPKPPKQQSRPEGKWYQKFFWS